MLKKRLYIMLPLMLFAAVGIGLLFGLNKLITGAIDKTEHGAMTEQLKEDKYTLYKDAEEVEGKYSEGYIENLPYKEQLIAIYGPGEGKFLGLIPTITAEGKYTSEFPKSDYPDLMQKLYEYFSHGNYAAIKDTFEKLVKDKYYNFTTLENGNVVRVYNSAKAAIKADESMDPEKIVSYLRLIQDPRCFMYAVIKADPRVSREFGLVTDSKLVYEIANVELLSEERILLDDYKDTDDIYDRFISEYIHRADIPRAVYIYEIKNADGIISKIYVCESFDMKYTVLGSVEEDSDVYQTYAEWEEM